MVLLSALTFSCKEESIADDPAMPRLALTKDTVSVSFTGGQAAVNVSAGADWKATAINEWIDMEPGEGPSGTRALMLEVGENPDIFPRIGRIVIKSANLIDTLYIEQEAAPITDKIELDPTSMTFIAAGEGKTLKIWANIPWTATPEADADWVELDVTSGAGDEVNETIHISVGEWQGLDPREAQITFKGGLADDVILTVTQEAFVPTIEVSEVYLDFLADGTGEKNTFTVTSNYAWAATAPDWIKFSPASGEKGTTQVTVTLEANENDDKQSGEIKFATTIGTAEAAVTIEQEGNVKEPDNITASVKSIEFAQDGTAEVSASVITANVDWTAVTSAEWLRIEPSTGSKGIETTMTVTALSANDTYEARTATITLTGGEATETIEVKQAGKASYLQLPVAWVIKDSDPEYMCAKSPRWGTTGANAYTFGTGEGIAYSETSELAYAEYGPKPHSITFIIAAEGHYTIKGKTKDNEAMTFYVPVEKIEAGTKLQFQTGTQCLKGMAKHWAIEFYDDGEWRMGDTGKLYSAGNGGTANVQLATGSATRTATYTLTKAIEKDYLKVRFRCVDSSVAISGKISASSTIRFCHRPADGVQGPTISIVE